MIDTDKLLDGLKDCYEEYDNMSAFYADVLWNIAKGNWDCSIPMEPQEEERICTDCTHYDSDIYHNRFCECYSLCNNIRNDCKSWENKR